MFDVASPLGGDVEEIGHFQNWKITFTWWHFSRHHLLGTMLRNFAIKRIFREKIRSHGSNFLGHHLLGAMLRKLAIFKGGKYVHMVPCF